MRLADGVHTWQARAYDKAGKEVAKFSGGGDQNHFDNFVKAVRSRKHEDLNCDIAEGHLSAALCHLANISYRLGEEQVVGRAAAAVSNDKAVNEFAAAMLAHLKANKVDVDGAEAGAGLQRLLTNDLAKVGVGRAQYHLLLH